MLGRLDHHRPRGVIPGAACAPGNLVELPRVKRPGAYAVVLAQRGEQDGADGHIDPHPQSVSSADHLEQARLRELFHQAPVLRQHAGVMDADTVADQPVERFAKAGGEPEIRDQLRDLVLLLARAHVDAHQGLGAVNRLDLAEVHHIDRHLAGGEQLLERFMDGGLVVVVMQRDGALG